MRDIGLDLGEESKIYVVSVEIRCLLNFIYLKSIYFNVITSYVGMKMHM